MMNGQEQAPAEAIESMLARQRSIVQRLRQLAARQRELVDAGQGEVLLSVLTERQSLIDDLSHGPTGIVATTERIDRDRHALDISQCARLRAQLHSVASELQQIMVQDQEDRGRLEAACEVIKQELGANTTARSARQAYGSRGLNPTRYADRTG